MYPEPNSISWFIMVFYYFPVILKVASKWCQSNPNSGKPFHKTIFACFCPCPMCQWGWGYSQGAIVYLAIYVTVALLQQKCLVGGGNASCKWTMSM